MNVFDILYRRKIYGIGVEGQDVSLSLDRVETGWLRHITHVTVLNLSSNYDLVRLSIFDGSTHFDLDELSKPLANELAVAKEDIILQEADVLVATLTGTSDDDRLEMVAIGWDMKLTL